MQQAAKPRPQPFRWLLWFVGLFDPSNMSTSFDTLRYDAIELIAPPLHRRLACWLYEGMLLFAVIFMASWLFSTLSQTRHALDNRHAQQGFLFVILGIYFTWFWAKGQTLAMKTWHIRVVGIDGQAVSQHRALARYLASWLWFMPSLLLCWLMDWSTGIVVSVVVVVWVLVWAFLSKLHPQQQYWHDVFAGTRLIATDKPL